MAYVLVDGSKAQRAKEIAALVTGKIAKNEEEAILQEKFSTLAKAEGVDVKKDDVVLFVYTKLGGLIRTPEEQAVADENAKEMRKKNKARKDKDE